MTSLRVESGGLEGEARARVEAGRRGLEEELGEELPVVIEGTDAGVRAVAWLRGERLAARGADGEAAWEVLAKRLREAAGVLSRYLDVQEFIGAWRRIAPEVEARVLRFTYRLGRREALARLELGRAPFLLLLDDESGSDAILFRLNGEALLFLEDPDVFGTDDARTEIAIECLVLDEEGRATGTQRLSVPTAEFTALDELVRTAETRGPVAVRNPETGLLALALADGAGGAWLAEYLFEDAWVGRERFEGFAPRDPAAPTRSWKDVLACPGCRADLPNPDEAALDCPGCGRSYALAATGAPRLLLPEDEPKQLEQDEEWIPNSAPKVLHYFLCRYPGGLVLDSGAGSAPLRAPNLVNLEIFPFESTTVVASGERLPFRDGAFDAVMSSAVLEHVPDPPAYCRELTRVVRSGGEARIDSAFLQPYHACPDHYYGTTLSGLRLASRDLEEVAAGTSHSQSPFVALQVWLHAYAAALPEQHREAFYASTVAELTALSPGLGPARVRIPPAERSRLASGVYLHGRRP
ncbi:MAG: class I SAM-dependent methyltransferase [Planctomycetota bacterium]